MYLKDRGKWEKEKGRYWESGSINIRLPLLQLLESQYRDTHELTVALEGMLTLTFKYLEVRGQVRTYMLKMKHL